MFLLATQICSTSLPQIINEWEKAVNTMSLGKSTDFPAAEVKELVCWALLWRVGNYFATCNGRGWGGGRKCSGLGDLSHGLLSRAVVLFIYFFLRNLVLGTVRVAVGNAVCCDVHFHLISAFLSGAVALHWC